MARGKWTKPTVSKAKEAAQKSEGIRRIAAERLRHFTEEGWSAAHDAGHVHGELSLVACCYAAPRPIYIMEQAERGIYVLFADPWPESWAPEHDKRGKHDRLRRLEIAGALIAAEIDRIICADQPEIEKEEEDGSTE
jgi:hypothetical protein